ncbi:mediator of RNA polymerase II transcription subunit 26-like isoform X1 [Anguilla rostrata]|uniref:mediator of RNA polymerase II transcription subunit 26-like isoform X1 n=1 Tax=Anguilla rostrata TaxID=7938 RepID=UPI0030CD3A40
MTAASATPQQMRDRLLQAIDSQSNQIRNMVAVLEVISYLERYPITKEALEETRLGKLINDVRKKTKDEDLAKRAKKLLRNWQKLIEPGQAEAPPRGAGPGTPGSANGGAHPCRADATPPRLLPAARPAPELKGRNDFHNTYSPKAEKASGRKRKGDAHHSPAPPAAKIAKATAAYERVCNSTPPPTNGVGGSPESLLALGEADAQRADPQESEKHSRIPVNAVRPCPSSPPLPARPPSAPPLPARPTCSPALPTQPPSAPLLPARPPSASALLRAAVMQQHAKPCSPRPPPCPAPSPLSPPLASPLPDSSLHRWAEPHPPQTPPLAPPLQGGSPTPPRPAPEWGGAAEAGGQVGRAESDGGGASGSERGGKRRKKKYRPRDYTVNLGGQAAEERAKPVRLKERRLTFDPTTGQIKSLTHKEPCPGEEPLGSAPPESLRTAPPAQPPHPPAAGPPLPNPLQQTNWKELSRNEIIQFYLNLQSNVLTSSGAQTPGAHFFMTEYLQREERHGREARKTHVLVPTAPDAGVPGVTREVTPDDVRRVGAQHWPGVNGCHDTKDNWYDWTQCISLDPHGDESQLHILPYVCLD